MEQYRTIKHVLERKVHKNTKVIYHFDIDLKGWSKKTRSKYLQQCIDYVTPRSFKEIKIAEQQLEKHASGRKRHNFKKLRDFYWHLRIAAMNGYGDLKLSNEELAKMFKVSTKTISRYIASLKSMNLISYIAIPLPKEYVTYVRHFHNNKEVYNNVTCGRKLITCRIIRVHFSHALCGYKNERIGFRRDPRIINSRFLSKYVPKEKWDQIPLEFRIDKEYTYWDGREYVTVIPHSHKRPLYSFIEYGFMEPEWYNMYMKIKDLGTGPQDREAKKDLPMDYAKLIGYHPIQRKKRFNRYLYKLKKEYPKEYEKHPFLYIPPKYILDEEGYIMEDPDSTEPLPPHVYGITVNDYEWNYQQLKRYFGSMQ